MTNKKTFQNKKSHKIDIDNIRKKIDSLDLDILDSLYKRVLLAKKIGTFKKDKKIYKPTREINIFQKIKSYIRKKKYSFSEEKISAIYREIISFSRSFEKKLQIAVLGPKGSHSINSAYNHFGSCDNFMEFNTISDIFTKINSGDYDFGFVPIENNTEGIVNETIDNLIQHDEIFIYGESHQRIKHFLVSNEKESQKIKKIISHPQAIGQCKSWLNNNLAHAEIIYSSSTSEAARSILKKKNVAAICSKNAANEFNLPIIAENIQSNNNNTTRFIVISKDKSDEVSKKDITSIVIQIKNKSGSLHDILQVFSQQKINLTKIFSRPSQKKSFEYFFFIELEGNEKDKKVKDSFTKIKKKAVQLKVLGSYCRKPI